MKFIAFLSTTLLLSLSSAAQENKQLEKPRNMKHASKQSKEMPAKKTMSKKVHSEKKLK